MSRQSMRLTVTVAVALFVAVGLFAGAAAADDGLLSGDDGTGLLTDDEGDDGDDGGIDISVGGGSDQAGGDGTVDCDADQTGAHECEKDGTLAGGPLTVDYEGNNSADPANQEGSFGDDLEVGANDQSFGGEIYCELSADTRENPCTYNYTAPGGGGAPDLPPDDPGLPEPPEDPGLPEPPEDPPISPPEDPGLPTPPEDPGLPIPPEDPGLPIPPEDPPITPPEDPGLPELPALPGPELPASILA